jgi:hypothetical protein
VVIPTYSTPGNSSNIADGNLTLQKRLAVNIDCLDGFLVMMMMEVNNWILTVWVLLR